MIDPSDKCTGCGKPKLIGRPGIRNWCPACEPKPTNWHESGDNRNITDQPGVRVQRYSVRMTAIATVSTTEYVEAETPEAAQEAARQKALAGDVVWVYDGAEDDIEVDPAELLDTITQISVEQGLKEGG